MTGERYEPDRVHGLSAAGKPLLVRYDLEALGRSAIDKDDPGRGGPGGFWRYREFLPVRRAENVVSLGEVTTPLIVRLARSAGRLGLEGGASMVKDEGRLPTGSFKARGLALAVAMAKELGLEHLAMPTNGNAGAAMAAYASRAGLKTHHLLSRRHAGDQRLGDRAAGRQGLPGQRPDQRLRQDRRRGQGGGRLVRRARP